jgi:predicted AAA+ superfamily ATPase
MIRRLLQQTIEQHFFKGKIILVIGPRQVGKTTLLQTIYNEFAQEKFWYNADDADVRELFRNPSKTKLKPIFANKKLIVIDEAQRLENAGLTLKIMIDNYKDVQIIATGSSAFELNDKLKESLTGRKFEYYLFPISTEELIQDTSYFEENRILEQRLLYGFYPEVINNPGQENLILRSIADSVLYKDLFALEAVKKPYLLENILKALALQVGSEVSYNELAQIVGADKETIERYIYLLEQSFVVFRLQALSRNVRNELKRSRKIYFYDNGIRNILINNFSPLALRNDKGALWENYLVSERKKRNHYHHYYCNTYFWRTTQQQEVDYIEERNGTLHAFEFKYSDNKRTRLPLTFSKAYPDHTYSVCTTTNYHEFVIKSDDV